MAKKNPTKADVADLLPEGAEIPEPKQIEKVGPIRAPQEVRQRGAVKIGGITAAPRNEKADAPDLPESENELVDIMIDEELHVNGKRLFGMTRLPRHQARSIVPMIQAKKRTDIEVYTGKNFLVKRGVDNRLIVKELGEDD